MLEKISCVFDSVILILTQYSFLLSTLCVCKAKMKIFKSKSLISNYKGYVLLGTYIARKSLTL